MQRQLEMKVARTRHSLTQRQPHELLKSEDTRTAPSIMPISRMRIPGQIESLQLVDCTVEKKRRQRDPHANADTYDDEDDDDDDDDDDDIEFYPMRRNPAAKAGHVKHELSDTFSLQEMTIMGTDDDIDDDDDNDATNADVRTAGIFDDDGDGRRCGRPGDNNADDDDDEEDDDDSQTLEFLTPKMVGGGGLFDRCSRWLSRLCCCWNKLRVK